MTSSSRELRLATWNVGWAAGRRRELVRERLASLDADVIVVTEGTARALPADYRITSADAGWGYRVQQAARRKVLLATRGEISEISTTGPTGMPGGRLVSATISVSDQPVRVHAVCIPWSHAHVSTGRCDATAWSEHEAYLRGLREVLAHGDASMPQIVMGDFNQRDPRGRQPERAHELLLSCLGDVRIATSGILPGLSAAGVNHIAASPTITVHDTAGISREGPGGASLSDHDGVIATAQF